MENLHAIVVDFWMAGMETTSTSLKWALLHLMKNPEKQVRFLDSHSSSLQHSNQVYFFRRRFALNFLRWLERIEEFR